LRVAAPTPRPQGELLLAETTVKTHVAQLGLTDRVHILVFATESSLVQPGTI
jgi:hypothetical protein